MSGCGDEWHECQVSPLWRLALPGRRRCTDLPELRLCSARIGQASSEQAVGGGADEAEQDQGGLSFALAASHLYIECPHCRRRRPVDAYDRPAKPEQDRDRYAQIFKCRRCGFEFAPIDTATGQGYNTAK